MIVEDNIINQKVLQATLLKLGFNSKVVSDGQQAVELYQKEPWDLILMDCQMPVMDGYEATRTIREIERSPVSQQIDRVYIIAVTANVLEEDVKKCFSAGMDDYLSKPIRKNRLIEAIEKYEMSINGNKLAHE